MHRFEVRLTDLLKECAHDIKGKEAIDYELIDKQIDSVVFNESIKKDDTKLVVEAEFDARYLAVLTA